MYKLTNSPSILRLMDNAYIPPESSLPDWQMYQSWLAEGNIPFPVDSPSPSQLLEKLDAENQLTQRNLREAIMLLVETVKTANPAVDLTPIPGIAKVFEVEAEAAKLREQLQ